MPVCRPTGPTRSSSGGPPGRRRPLQQPRDGVPSRRGRQRALSKVQFDMPHALVTLTDVDGNVEIEVWPKSGQSAFVIVPPDIARAIAERIRLMADAADAAVADAPEPAPSNVVDLASRRKLD